MISGIVINYVINIIYDIDMGMMRFIYKHDKYKNMIISFLLETDVD